MVSLSITYLMEIQWKLCNIRLRGESGQRGNEGRCVMATGEGIMQGTIPRKFPEKGKEYFSFHIDRCLHIIFKEIYSYVSITGFGLVQGANRTYSTM